MPSPQRTKHIVREELARVPGGQNFPRGIQTRIELFDDFAQIPAINGDVALGKNLDWEILGAGTPVSAQQAYSRNGGIILTTDTATAVANDQAYLSPHLDTLISQGAVAGWMTTDNSPELESVMNITTLTAEILRMGLFEDAVQPADFATVGSDDNAAFFIFDEDNATSATNFVCVVNVAGVDTSFDSGVLAVAGADFRLRIFIDETRRPHFYINLRLVFVGPVMTTSVNLNPQLGFATDTTAARNGAIRFIRRSKLIGV